MLKLIDPVYKNKLGVGQSYPIATEKISKALESVPQYSELSLNYTNSDGASLGTGSGKQDVSDLLAFQQVLSVNYSHRLSAWSIQVNRVNSSEKRLVKPFLISIGLPLLRTWLVKERRETWYNGFWYFQIGLNQAKDEYALKETFNHQLIMKQVAKVEI